MPADQSAGFFRRQAAGRCGADVALEAADGRSGQRTKDTVRLPFVVAQPAQRLLHPQAIRLRHTGLIGRGRHRRG